MLGNSAPPDQMDAAALRIGEWVVDPELNAMRRDGLEHRIEPKVMKVLLALAAHPNRVVAKEDLIATVWPSLFVSDDVLTRCISILRRVTHDDPHAPSFIQTVPKVGYRLVAPVFPLPEAAAATEVAAPVLPGVDAEPTTGAAVAGIAGRSVPRARRRLLVAFAALLIAAMVGIVWAMGRGASRATLAPELPASFRTVQFTFAAGEQTQPAFSPDGRAIAYVHATEDGSTHEIFVKQIGTESVRQLTPGRDEEQFSPAWSPDGRRIAYLAQSKGGLALEIAEVGTGPARQSPRKVYTPQERCHWDQGALSWSPDGKSLIFPDHSGGRSNSSIFQLELATMRVKTLTSPPAGWEGDLNPAWSPDGRNIAFTRASETAVRDIYWITIGDGRLHQLTHDRMNIDSLAWSAASDAILFASNRGGKFALWRVGLTARQAQRLPVGTEDAFQPAVGRQGQFAYTQGSAIWSIVRLEGGPGKGAASIEPVLSSTQQDSAPSISPDGRYFAMQSVRSGSQEIWICATDGRGLRQLTSMGGPLTGSPSWSNSGDRILFDSRPDGHSHIFMIAVAGGKPQQLTFGDANDIVPRWSQDGRMVYFRSNRGGMWQLWRVAANGGVPVKVTTGDGIEPQESVDGKWLYYALGDGDGIWRVPVTGGSEMRVLSQPAAGYWGYWQLTSRGIFYLDLASRQATIRVLNPESKKDILFAVLKQKPPLFAGLSVSASGTEALATEERDEGRHITLIEAIADR